MSRRARRWNPRQLRQNRATVPTYPSYALTRAFRHRDRCLARRREPGFNPVHELLTLFAARAVGHIIGCLFILLEGLDTPPVLYGMSRGGLANDVPKQRGRWIRSRRSRRYSLGNLRWLEYVDLRRADYLLEGRGSNRRGGWRLMMLPRFTADGLLDYMGLAIGLTIGFSLLRPVGEQVQQAISKR